MSVGPDTAGRSAWCQVTGDRTNVRRYGQPEDRLLIREQRRRQEARRDLLARLGGDGGARDRLVAGLADLHLHAIEAGDLDRERGDAGALAVDEDGGAAGLRRDDDRVLDAAEAERDRGRGALARLHP